MYVIRTPALEILLLFLKRVLEKLVQPELFILLGNITPCYFHHLV